MSQRAQRIIEAARKLPVPEGTYAVGLGLLISGITAYGFQILAFKGLTKSEYAALNGLWILVFVVAPGFFLPLEQEVGRAVADRRSRPLGGGPVVKKAARAGAILAGSLMAFSVIGAARRSASPSGCSTGRRSCSSASSSRWARTRCSTSRAARSRATGASGPTG